MSCDHYWRDGILRVESNEPDPHREACVVCRREHDVREALIHALSLAGGTADGDPDWEARVWSRIARFEHPSPRTWRRLGAGLATACVLLLLWWVLGRLPHPDKTRPRIEVVPGEIATRSTSPHVGDRIRIAVAPTDEARIYRADQLVLRCPAGANRDGCTYDARGMVAELRLTAVGNYHLVVISSATAEPVGRFDRDVWAIASAGGEYQITELSVR